MVRMTPLELFVVSSACWGTVTAQYIGTIYASNGVGAGFCPTGSLPLTQAQCTTVSATIVQGGSGTAYDELLSILRISNTATTFGDQSWVQTTVQSFSGTTMLNGCSMYVSGSRYDGEVGHCTDSCGSTGHAQRALVCMVSSSSSSGDPHLELAHGGKTDLRGEDGKVFVMHSSPNASFAVMTTESNFMQNFGKQKVNGSHFTKAFITLCTNATGKLVHITVGAAVSPWSPPITTVEVVGETAAPRKIAAGSKYNPTFTMEDVSVHAESGSHVIVQGAGWEFGMVRRPLYKPLPMSKTRHYLNLRIQPKAGARPAKAHGIIGQSFGKVRKIDGKKDDYSNKVEVTTSAQAEGAIDGVYTDYMINDPFETGFKYSRFDAAKAPMSGELPAPGMSASATSDE